LVGYLGVSTSHTIDLTKFIRLLLCQVDDDKQVNSGVMAYIPLRVPEQMVENFPKGPQVTWVTLKELFHHPL